MASLADDSIFHFIENDLKCHNICFAQCPQQTGHMSPNSYIILNSNSGTRTILHTNLGLPELTFENFKKIKIDHSWIHFEGRPNVDQTEIMIQHIQKIPSSNRPKISYEMEKLGRNYDRIIPLVDIMFISKEYALSCGFRDKIETVSKFHLKKFDPLKQQKIVICAWGDQGIHLQISFQ